MHFARRIKAEHEHAESGGQKPWTSILSLATSNLATPIIAVLSAPLIARSLSTPERGIYAGITAPVTLLGVIGTLGAQDALTSLIANQPRLSATSIIRTTRLVSLIASVITAAVAVAVGTAFLPPSVGWPGWLCLIFGSAASVIFNTYLGAAVGVAAFRLVALARYVTAVPRLVLILIPFVLGRLTIEYALLVFAGVPFGAAIVVGLAVEKRVSDLRAEGKDHLNPLRVMRYGLAVLPGLVGVVSLSRLDQTLGSRLTSAEQLGLYAVAVSVGEIPQVVAVAIRTYYMGASTRALRVARAFRDATLATAGIGVIGVVVIPVLLPAIFGTKYDGSVVPAIILVAGTTCLAVQNLANGLLIRFGHVRRTYWPLGIGVMVNVGLLLILRRQGAIGMALASIAAYSTSALFLVTRLARVRRTEANLELPT